MMLCYFTLIHQILLSFFVMNYTSNFLFIDYFNQYPQLQLIIFFMDSIYFIFQLMLKFKRMVNKHYKLFLNFNLN